MSLFCTMYIVQNQDMMFPGGMLPEGELGGKNLFPDPSCSPTLGVLSIVCSWTDTQVIDQQVVRCVLLCVLMYWPSVVHQLHGITSELATKCSVSPAGSSTHTCCSLMVKVDGSLIVLTLISDSTSRMRSITWRLCFLISQPRWKD